MQELYTFLIAKISAIEKRSLIDDRSLPPRANARGTRKFGEYSDRFEAIAQERRGGYTCPLRDLEGGDGGARREEGNKTAEGRDGRNRRNLLVPEGARRARTDYPSIISGRGGSGWRGEERRGRKKWRARENRGAAREKTRRLDEFSGGFSVPLNARTPRREPRYVSAWRAPFVSAARNDVINIVARLSNLRLRATRSRSGPLSPLVPTRPPASLSLSVSRSATPLSWGWLSSPRFEPLSRAENPLRCSRVTSSSLGPHHFSNVRRYFPRGGLGRSREKPGRQERTRSSILSNVQFLPILPSTRVRARDETSVCPLRSGRRFESTWRVGVSQREGEKGRDCVHRYEKRGCYRARIEGGGKKGLWRFHGFARSCSGLAAVQTSLASRRSGARCRSKRSPPFGARGGRGGLERGRVTDRSW